MDSGILLPLGNARQILHSSGEDYVTCLQTGFSMGMFTVNFYIKINLFLLITEILGKQGKSASNAVTAVSPVSFWEGAVEKLAEMPAPPILTVYFYESKRYKWFDKHQINVRTTTKPTQFQ